MKFYKLEKSSVHGVLLFKSSICQHKKKHVSFNTFGLLVTTDSLKPEYTSELALLPQDIQVPIVIYMEIHPTRTIECCQTIKINWLKTTATAKLFNS